jgi:hypothetical protein
MSAHYSNLINALLVHYGIRPACLFQMIDYPCIGDGYYTLEKIKELFPDLYHIPNYQGILISKTNITDTIDTCEKLGHVLGYPYADEFNKMITENISGYMVELICYYHNGITCKTQIMVNRCIELNKLNEFKEIMAKANELVGYTLDDIEILQFKIRYEKNYNTNEIITCIYNRDINHNVLFHIENIIYNMGLDATMIDSFNEYKWFHRTVITRLLYLDIYMTKYGVMLPEFTLIPIQKMVNLCLRI